MNQYLKHIAIVVDDYDEAIEFYTKKLHFSLIEDTYISDTKRWVLVQPKGINECSILLAKAANEKQKSRVGDQTGGRVFLFLCTDNFNRDFQNLKDNNIKIVREPSIEAYGTVAVFEDLYSNLWDLIEYKKREEAHFYTTSVYKLTDITKLESLISELKSLRELSMVKSGIISFDIQQMINDPTKIIVRECLEEVNSHNDHLCSLRLQALIKLKIIELESTYTSKNI